MLARALFSVLSSALAVVPLAATTVSAPRAVAPLSFGPADVASPIQSVVPNGEQYVVFWLEYDHPHTGARLMATRLSASGAPVATSAVARLNGALKVTAARAPKGGFLVGWRDREGTYVASVDTSLRMGAPLTLTSEGRIDLACNDVTCAAFVHDSVVDVFVLHADASIERGPVRVANGLYDGMSVAGSGSTFLLSYADATQPGRASLHLIDSTLETLARIDNDLLYSVASDRQDGYVAASHSRIARLDANANVIAQRPFDIHGGHAYLEDVTITSSDEGFAVVAVAHDDAGTILAPPPPSELLMLRFDDDLNALDAEPVVVMSAGSNHSTHLASNGRSYLTGWNHLTGGWVGLVRALPASGNAARPVDALRTGPLNQLAHAIARSATNALAVWGETDIGRTNRIKAVRLTRDGGALDMVPIEIGEGGSPVIAGSDGRNFLVAWQLDRSGIGTFGTALVDALMGEVSARATFQGTPGTAIVSDGHSFFLPVSRGSHLVVARFAATGDFITEFTVDTATYRGASIAYSRDTLLVAYARTDGSWARAFSIDGRPKNEAVPMADQSYDAVIVGSDSGFIVAQTWGWFTFVTVDGRSIGAAQIPNLPLHSFLGGAVIEGRAAFFGYGHDGFEGILFFDGAGKVPRVLEVDMDELVRAVAGDGQSILVLSQREIDGVTRVTTRNLSFGDPLRRRAVRR